MDKTTLGRAIAFESAQVRQSLEVLTELLGRSCLPLSTVLTGSLSLQFASSFAAWEYS